ncbi:MAG TPA: LamG domain-containing protein, partial [Verrucomicrobiae bacterium]|nr:LamG domain-containing protein [Verrucomicrobiae bacterium]
MKTKVILFLCSVLGAAPMASEAANNALLFDGVNDYVTFGSASRLGASNFTIEVWFRRTGAGVSTSTGIGGITAVPLLAKGRAEGDGSNRDINYFLGIRPSDNVLVADFEEGANGTPPGLNHPIAGATPISNNVWHHAAATYDGATWRLYLNGALERELAVNQPVRANSIQHASLATALNSSGAARGFFRGSLDEARIWNYARSGAEIASSKNLEITSQTGLIGCWGMNGSGGTKIYDSSGNGVTGTLLNGPRRIAGFQASITRGPYLQLGTPHSVVVRWRTDAATDSR